MTVRSARGPLVLRPWTYCFGNGCADGAPPANPLDVGALAEVVFEFPLDDWTFTATFETAGLSCPRRQTVSATQIAQHTYVVRPAGYAQAYDVTLFGQGNGDLFVSFRWTTPVVGELPRPSAGLALIADHDGRPDSYGVELMILNLENTPRDAEAEITVTAANGERLTFMATRATGCYGEGGVYWDGPDHSGIEASQLGPSPFTYEVNLTLDGTTYNATATWPDDQIEGNEPSVTLEFVPELPALQ